MRRSVMIAASTTLTIDLPRRAFNQRRTQNFLHEGAVRRSFSEMSGQTRERSGRLLPLTCMAWPTEV